MKTVADLMRAQIEARLDGLLYNLSIAKDKFPDMYKAYIPVWEFEVVVYELALKGFDAVPPSLVAQDFQPLAEKIVALFQDFDISDETTAALLAIDVRKLIEKAVATPPSPQAATVDIERVKTWFYSKPRKQAQATFTAGDERQIAYMLEDAQSGVLSHIAAPKDGT